MLDEEKIWKERYDFRFLDDVRSLARDVVRGDLRTTWIYLVGPAIGAL